MPEASPDPKSLGASTGGRHGQEFPEPVVSTLAYFHARRQTAYKYPGHLRTEFRNRLLRDWIKGSTLWTHPCRISSAVRLMIKTGEQKGALRPCSAWFMQRVDDGHPARRLANNDVHGAPDLGKDVVIAPRL